MSTTRILHKNTNSQMAVALHKRILRAIAHLGRGGCADIVFYCSGLRPVLYRIRTSSGKALTSNPLQTSKFCRADDFYKSSVLFFRSICECNSHTSLSRSGIGFGYRAINFYDLLYPNFTPTFVITENPNKIKGV